MNRINTILNNQKFCKYLQKISQIEKRREFCKHDMCHLLDVARIAYIMVLENNIQIKKETIYVAALLHDIRKWVQYEKGVAHELASAKLAEDILIECGFMEDEILQILNIILNHRKKDTNNLINSIFYSSDKISRNCFRCKAISKCNWPEKKKNYNIKY
ncbi:HD domain-containing protein [Clostridium sp. BJN0013]|uniref:HD domain-containing protein n=1 Tax=Clostridium sp. BJN0013 TaxID=3236840 RepID=UPI0034C6A07F